MEAKKVLFEDTTVMVKDIALLTVAEAMKIDICILKGHGWWWLRDAGARNACAAFVNDAGIISHSGLFVRLSGFGVRPVLKIAYDASSNLKVCDKIQIAGEYWTIVSDRLALCDRVIEKMAFRKRWDETDTNAYVSANEYKKSDIAKFLCDWADENGIKF